MQRLLPHFITLPAPVDSYAEASTATVGATLALVSNRCVPVDGTERDKRRGRRAGVHEWRAVQHAHRGVGLLQLPRRPCPVPP